MYEIVMTDRVRLFWTFKIKNLMPPPPKKKVKAKTQGSIPKNLSFFLEKNSRFCQLDLTKTKGSKNNIIFINFLAISTGNTF